MRKGRPENFKPLSTEEARERGKKGGIVSGENRREKRYIQDAIRKALSGNYDIEDKTLKGYDALAFSIIKQALGGNVQAFKEIRDTIEKPIENINATIENTNKSILKEYLEFIKNE